MALTVGALFLFRSGFESVGAPHHLSRSFLLFTAVALSITALPVLAAIVRECGIAGTVAGRTATAAAGIMDMLAWLILAAALVGTAHQTGRPLAVTVVLLAAFTVTMLAIVRPVLRWWMTRSRSQGSNQVPLAFTLALGSAWITAALGLHPVFGGFLAGLTLPRIDGVAKEQVLRPLEETGNLLLPLFFVVTGLSLTIGSFGVDTIAMLALVCVIASVGKVAPAYAAARAAGLAQRDATAIAALVNARGLTELIALNVGLTDAIITREFFSILVLMALITTAVTAPVLSWLALSASARPPRKRFLPLDHRHSHRLDSDTKT